MIPFPRNRVINSNFRYYKSNDELYKNQVERSDINIITNRYAGTYLDNKPMCRRAKFKTFSLSYTDVEDPQSIWAYHNNTFTLRCFIRSKQTCYNCALCCWHGLDDPVRADARTKYSTYWKYTWTELTTNTLHWLIQRFNFF